MKKIWILNHYATGMFLDQGGRHYCFAKYLMQEGYSVRIFCANTVHNSDAVIETDGALYSEDSCDGIPFVFVKARPYKGNGKQRILNMLDYYRNVQKAAKHFEKPDVIIGSSVHPLACVAAIKLAKKYNVPCIAEIRDLWPESIVAYGIAKKNNPVIKLLYQLEKWIYTKADSIIFTMEGGKDYIIEKGWDKAHGGTVDLDKVYHINNGVDLESFDYNCEHYSVTDADLENADIFKVVYVGSIRAANGLENLMDCAKLLIGETSIRFLVFGDGEDLGALKNRRRTEQLENIVFKGRVSKNAIPFVLSKSNITILNYNSQIGKMYRFGSSQNKLFEYLASGKPVLSNVKMNYSLLERYKCGVELASGSPESMAGAILRLKSMDNERYSELCRQARIAAEDYDFKVLTQKLIKVITTTQTEA